MEFTLCIKRLPIAKQVMLTLCVYKKMTCSKPVLLLFISSLFCIGMSLSNEWSNCSRICGMGISHRIIPCQNGNCTKVEKEFRVCNRKECPDNYPDFRSEQCQRYGKELVPFINTSNPCKLMCMSPGQKSTEKGIVIDGTPCLSGGVCVDGTCIPVGCNGILGSEEKIDKCGRCDSTSGLCLHVPCTINHKPATNEYITALPAGSTRIKISWTSSCRISNPSNLIINGKELTNDGPLKKKLTIKINCQEDDPTVTCGYNAVLYDAITFDAQNILKHNQKYQWVIGNGFTKCSQTCGAGGVRTSRIYCQNVATQRIVEALLCNNLSKKHLDIHIRKCNMPPCPYKWKVSDWSPCSKSCGGGHRSRNVTCVQVINKLIHPMLKDPAQCTERKPTSQKKCNQHHCYNHWREGPWSDCSSSCGNGTRKRNLTCIDAHGMEIQTNSCSLPENPKEKKCIGKMCTYKWIESDWSNCSLGCGQGVQTRSVYCQYIKEKRVVNDSLCLQHLKPTTLKQCQGSHCIGEWKVDNWGPCESECHMKGLKHRNSFCILNGSSVSKSKCNNSSEPKTDKVCYKTEGCKPHWVPLPWGKCSKSCNGGIRARGLECKLGDKVVDHADCPNARPTQYQKCNVHVPCPAPACKPTRFCPRIINLHNQGFDVTELCERDCCNPECETN